MKDKPRDINEALDMAINAAIVEGSKLFRTTDTRDRSAEAYNNLKSAINAERAKLEVVKNKDDLAPFCKFLDTVVDFYSPEKPGSRKRFNSELKAIIRDQRRAFLKMVSEILQDKDSAASKGQQSLEDGVADDVLIDKKSEGIEFDDKIYESLVASCIVDWFQNLPDLFEQLRIHFGSKDVLCTTEEFEAIISDTSILFLQIIDDFRTLVLEYLPFENVRDADAEDQEDEQKLLKVSTNCWEAMIEQFQIRFEGLLSKLPIKFDLEAVNGCIFHWAEEHIDIDKILDRTQKKTPLDELEKKSIDRATCYPEEVLEGSFKGACGTLVFGRRYTYAQNEDKSVGFQASPDAMLYPNEASVFEVSVRDKIEDEKMRNEDEAVRYFESYAGQYYLMEWAEYLNRNFHGGLDVRSEEHLTILAKECTVRYFEEVGVVGFIGDLTKLSVGEKTISSPSLRNTLPLDDLSEDEKPKHVSVEVFARINSVLRWARGADKPGSRSIHKWIVGMTSAITLHLATLNEKQILTYLSQLEGLKALLGDDIKMIKKNVPPAVWAGMALNSTLHLAEDLPTAEADLLLRIKKYLEQLNCEIDKLEGEIVAFVNIESEDAALEMEISNITAVLDEKNIALSAVGEQLRAKSTELATVDVDDIAYTEILNAIIAFKKRHLELKKAVDELKDKKQVASDRKEQLQPQISQLESKKTELQDLIRKKEQKLSALSALMDDGIDS